MWFVWNFSDLILHSKEKKKHEFYWIILNSGICWQCKTKKKKNWFRKDKKKRFRLVYKCYYISYLYSYFCSFHLFKNECAMFHFDLNFSKIFQLLFCSCFVKLNVCLNEGISSKWIHSDGCNFSTCFLCYYTVHCTHSRNFV